MTARVTSNRFDAPGKPVEHAREPGLRGVCRQYDEHGMVLVDWEDGPPTWCSPDDLEPAPPTITVTSAPSALDGWSPEEFDGWQDAPRDV